jgi:hypothetical protein
MSNDVKLEQAADEAARSALSEAWPDGYDHFERWIFKAGFLAGVRYQSQQREAVIEKMQQTGRPMALKRMWIDQPSTLQPLHSLHGTNVLAQPETDKVMRVYFLSGDVISQRVPNEALSPGWRPAPIPEREAVLEEAAKACEEQRRIFASPEYAAGQPMSSFGEWFGAGRCAEAIRALKTTH